MKIGVFFGGQSREREISFAGGRTVYDNLNKALFEPVPIFIDSLGNFILLNWEYLYKGSIRDFYPPTSELPDSENGFQVYIESIENLTLDKQQEMISKVGKQVFPNEFNSLFDFAFLALHGPYGEDGNIQGILEWYNIPYSGSGVLPSAIGVNKSVQKTLLENAGFPSPKYIEIHRESWINLKDRVKMFEELTEALGLPLVTKAPNQGSSIGISILTDKNFDQFEQAVNRAFFIKNIKKEAWGKLDKAQKVKYVDKITDIREGIGLPVHVNEEIIHHPEKLLTYLNRSFDHGEEIISLTSTHAEEKILIESFLHGKEFSCIVIQGTQGNPFALPPTEIRKGAELFDYRSKYLPGISRKVTPIEIDEATIEKIREACCQLFENIYGNVYARIDGFYTDKGEIYLNDPNTTSGMLPSSFFFHQAAEIGLNPSQFLTYIIRTSLQQRILTGKKNQSLKSMLQQLDTHIKTLQQAIDKKIRIAVIMGGFSSERHISVESGRNIYEKLSASAKYKPIPVFLTGSETAHELYTIPVNVMLKDNADDIKEKINHLLKNGDHPLVCKIQNDAKTITTKYTEEDQLTVKKLSYQELSEHVDQVFIALHGRPGEDGAIQHELEKVGLSYNGSGQKSSQVTINKYKTNEILGKHGILVARHMLVHETDWQQSKTHQIEQIESLFPYPFIAKPADDGCSSAVKKIKNRKELEAFAALIFRQSPPLMDKETDILKLSPNEEFPIKNYFMIEELIEKKGASHFLEITGGLLTHINNAGENVFELFEPSETIAAKEVLSLEEKFLTGEGQNITPARFDKDPLKNEKISGQVKAVLEKTAKILEVEGYARIDAFVRVFNEDQVETIIIEVNSLPGMTPATAIFHQCAINGYKPYEFIDAILDYSLKKKLSTTQKI